MNIYQKYLVCYDIENDKTRKKFFDKKMSSNDIHWRRNWGCVYFPCI